ncbi:hypothetical protein SAMN05518849_12833 [Sphingobium sp. AP50]|uniref:hypothetical protein n=1 Tax=Sphingobium sp. AP50 TaxID=1884369 RepID=UPI0008C02128|nr:hypothetical protein [Sphingobium sp. AP50]SEK02203.1 hypothetical protein SAMN05518849_12833 [Sphingobium sp. AP50]
MQMISTAAAQDQAAFHSALQSAQRRARSSYFDQHVISDAEGGYITIDEGDYGVLPMPLIERIVHTVRGERIDEY